jgi:uncharacterized small protein (DUF1192 family)
MQQLYIEQRDQFEHSYRNCDDWDGRDVCEITSDEFIEFLKSFDKRFQKWENVMLKTQDNLQNVVEKCVFDATEQSVQETSILNNAVVDIFKNLIDVETQVIEKYLSDPILEEIQFSHNLAKNPTIQQLASEEKHFINEIKTDLDEKQKTIQNVANTILQVESVNDEIATLQENIVRLTKAIEAKKLEKQGTRDKTSFIDSQNIEDTK